MGKWTAALATVLFLGPDTGYAQGVFKDNPLLKTPYDQVPYYAVGLISRGRDYPEKYCTGIPLSPTVILTAAHCLYDWSVGSWGGPLFYYSAVAARDGGASIKAKTYIIPKETAGSFMSNSFDALKARAFDFGVMILERALDESYASVFSVVAKDDSSAVEVPDIPPLPIPSASSTGAVGGLPDIPGESDAYRTIVGYPVGYEEDRSEMQRVSFCPIVPYWRSDKGNRVRYFYAYRCSTNEGMSGAPIFYREARSYKTIGIHLAEKEDESFNFGLFIDHDILLRIEYWKNNQVADSEKDVEKSFL